MASIESAIAIVKEDLAASRFEEAARSASQLMAALGNDPRLAALRGWALLMKGDRSSGADVLESAASAAGDDARVLATCGVGLTRCERWARASEILRRARVELGFTESRALMAEGVALARGGEKGRAREVANLLKSREKNSPALAVLACELDPQLRIDLSNPKAEVTQGKGCSNTLWVVLLIGMSVASGGLLAPVALILFLLGLWAQRHGRRSMERAGMGQDQIPGSEAFRARLERERIATVRCPRCNRDVRFWPEAGLNTAKAGGSVHGFKVRCDGRRCGAKIDPPEDRGSSTLCCNVRELIGEADATSPVVFF